jgi:hypothetical protein
MKILIEDLRNTVNGENSGTSPDTAYSAPKTRPGMTRPGTGASVEKSLIAAAQKTLSSSGVEKLECKRIVSWKDHDKEAA